MELPQNFKGRVYWLLYGYLFNYYNDSYILTFMKYAIGVKNQDQITERQN